MSMVSHLRETVRDYCPGGAMYAKLKEIDREVQSIEIALAASRVMGIVESIGIAKCDHEITPLFMEAYGELIELERDALGESVANSPTGRPVTLVMVAKAMDSTSTARECTEIAKEWQTNRSSWLRYYSGWKRDAPTPAGKRGRPEKLYDSDQIVAAMREHGTISERVIGEIERRLKKRS